MRKSKSVIGIGKKMEPRFLNVDLDIASRLDPSPLLDAFGKKVTVLHSERIRGIYYLRLELAMYPKSIEDAARRFSLLLERLTGAARDFWKKTRSKEFNVGFKVRRNSHYVSLSIPNEVVSRISKTGGTLGITVYD